jgi:hypothetical protein
MVDASLTVYGIENLRIAMDPPGRAQLPATPWLPGVIVGERAGEILKTDHKL